MAVNSDIVLSQSTMVWALHSHQINHIKRYYPKDCFVYEQTTQTCPNCSPETKKRERVDISRNAPHSG